MAQLQSWGQSHHKVLTVEHHTQSRKGSQTRLGRLLPAPGAPAPTQSPVPRDTHVPTGHVHMYCNTSHSHVKRQSSPPPHAVSHTQL